MLTLKQRLRRLAPYFRASRMPMAGSALALVVAASTEPAIPALLKTLMDRGFQAGDLPMWAVPAAIVTLFVVRGFSAWLANYGLTLGSQNAVLAMRRAMFRHLLEATPDLFSRNTTSSLTNGLVYEIQQGANLLMSSANILVRDSLTALALLAYLIYLDWKLTLFIVVLFPIVGVLVRIVSKRLHRLTIAGQNASDDLAYVVEENVLAWRIVRLHGAAAQETTRFDASARLMRALGIKQSAAGSLMTPITQALAAIALSAVLVMALRDTGHDRTTVGGFVAFISAMLLMIQPFKHLSDVMAPLTRGTAAMERGIELIENVPIERGGTLAPGRVRGDIELRRVSLNYGKHVRAGGEHREEAPQDGDLDEAARIEPRADLQPIAALAEVTLSIRAGEAVALVGPSGAGKTSLVNLLPRFIEPTSGSVLLDGAALDAYDIVALRTQFALVSQDVVLFNDTVAANVALGADIDLARVRDALAGAYLLDHVLTMPGGLDASIGHNGTQLSGGQRQRLAIARAIYKDAPVLILDEATSALDSESERAVQAALDVLMRGRTTLVIAHRLSTIEHADRVIVMDQGRIVESGPHAELLAQGGLYARLHAIQFRG
ncbi:MAG TPA: ABC transporter transmembrane domain-containing protein [Burkholderiaceae bacterium]|nr:ABC transporter transmembrane domain-containing protein [Burkholderiaceae bacterium]